MIRFCGECGNKLKDIDVDVCSKCGADPARATKHCPNCGAAKKSENAVVCLECGQSLTTRDPTIAILLSIGCFLFLGAPSLAYIYLGNIRKGLVYLIGSWGLAFVIFAIYMVGTVATWGIGAFCLLPLFLIPFVLDIFIIYDVYLISKGRKSKLPEF